MDEYDYDTTSDSLDFAEPPDAYPAEYDAVGSELNDLAADGSDFNGSEINEDDLYDDIDFFPDDADIDWSTLDDDSLSESDDIETDDEEYQTAEIGDFSEDNWNRMDLDEKKASMENLAQDVIADLDLEYPPQIAYYSGEPGDFGSYSAEDNTLYINEDSLSSENLGEGLRANEEAADTIAHELWHAHQHERAENPVTELDYMYRDGFENYIGPEDDFEAYQDQLVESEARDYANQVRQNMFG